MPDPNEGTMVAETHAELNEPEAGMLSDCRYQLSRIYCICWGCGDVIPIEKVDDARGHERVYRDKDGQPEPGHCGPIQVRWRWETPSEERAVKRSYRRLEKE